MKYECRYDIYNIMSADDIYNIKYTRKYGRDQDLSHFVEDKFNKRI